MSHREKKLLYQQLIKSVLFFLFSTGAMLIASDITTEQEITVHRINAGGSNVFILEGRDNLLCIDAGYPGNERKIYNKIKALAPKKLSLILITHGHFDHYGCALSLKELTGAPIAIHQLDSSAMAEGKTPIPLTKGVGKLGKMIFPLSQKVWKPVPTQADIVLEEGDSLSAYGFNAVVIHTPGHTDGSISLFVNDSLLFVSDLIVSHPTVKRQCFYAVSWEKIDTSMEKIKKLSPSLVYPGHGRPVISRQKLTKL